MTPTLLSRLSWLFVLPVLSVALTSGCDTGTEPVVAERQTLFASGDSGYPIFRIPALIETPTGALLAFAEARHAGLADTGDIDLVVRRSDDGGLTWEPLTLVHDAGEDTWSHLRTPGQP